MWWKFVRSCLKIPPGAEMVQSRHKLLLTSNSMTTLTQRSMIHALCTSPELGEQLCQAIWKSLQRLEVNCADTKILLCLSPWYDLDLDLEQRSKIHALCSWANIKYCYVTSGATFWLWPWAKVTDSWAVHIECGELLCTVVWKSLQGLKGYRTDTNLWWMDR